MLHPTRVIEQSTSGASISLLSRRLSEALVGASGRPNAYKLLTLAAVPIRGPRAGVLDVRALWIDTREELDVQESKR